MGGIEPNDTFHLYKSCDEMEQHEQKRFQKALSQNEKMVVIRVKDNSGIALARHLFKKYYVVTQKLPASAISGFVIVDWDKFVSDENQ